jgi:hypothetical protein
VNARSRVQTAAMRLSNGSVLVVGALLLLWGAVSLVRRTRFIEGSRSATGPVSWSTRYTLGVTPDGEVSPVLVNKPWLHLYRIGERVPIRYDPRRHYPGQLSPYGRVDNFAGLWFGPAMFTGTGLLLLCAGAAAARSRRFRLNMKIGVNGPPD